MFCKEIIRHKTPASLYVPSHLSLFLSHVSLFAKKRNFFFCVDKLNCLTQCILSTDMCSNSKEVPGSVVSGSLDPYRHFT
jgi:hypothetical protein